MNRDEKLAERILENFIAAELAEPALLTSLAAYINRLIVEDFDQLIFILYRVDVSEGKLKKMLADNSETDAGRLIAELIIERQLQKIKSREHHKKDVDPGPGEEEKW